jgi:hypothetical protein
MPIRQSAFETNSSSMHSIVLSKIEPGDILDIPTPDANGNIVVGTGYEFGWGYETYNDFYTKLAYLIISNSREGYPEIDTLKRIIKKFTKGELVYPEYAGDIDHQSSDMAKNTLKTEEDIVAFLFNPKTTLIIDNDNH